MHDQKSRCVIRGCGGVGHAEQFLRNLRQIMKISYSPGGPRGVLSAGQSATRDSEMGAASSAASSQAETAAGGVFLEMTDVDLLNRFSSDRDEAAFAALVNRHGPMVQGVCRRIVEDVHAAEDVFQAVFLVLARKSTAIRRPELLANWLYGVACRIARKARVKAIRNEARRRWAVKTPTGEQLLDLDLEWHELKQVLDEEISRLPEKYRVPLVLCYLHGQTNAQAAAQLGWPAGSMSERLSRAREILRKRLTRRGLNLSAALLAVLLSQKAAVAAVSPALVANTAETAVAYAAEGQADNALSPNVLELVLDATGPAISAYQKLIVAVMALLLAAVLARPSLGFSKISQWFGTSASANSSQSQSSSCHK
jgi:RNA polymerase sigma-70 factor (ECF subfamily)